MKGGGGCLTDLSLDNNALLWERKEEEHAGKKSKPYGFFDSWWASCVNTNICMCVAVCVCLCSLSMHAFTNWPCRVFLEYLPRGAFGISFIAGKKNKIKVHSFDLPFKLEWFQSFLEERKGGGGERVANMQEWSSWRQRKQSTCLPSSSTKVESTAVWGETKASRNINTSYGNVSNFGSQPSLGGGTSNEQPLTRELRMGK